MSNTDKELVEYLRNRIVALECELERKNIEIERLDNLIEQM
jgi:uncharacterized protein (DUF2461 family)